MPKNSELLKRVARFQKCIKISFRSKRHLTSALLHASFLNENPHLELSDYERLEFFGDAILNHAVCEKLFKYFPDANEGILSRMRSILVSKKLLVVIAQKLSLGKFIMIGKGEQKNQSDIRTKLLADTLEALIGAIYLDRGFGAARNFVWKYWEPFFNEKKLLKFDPNPKSSLQEICQKIYRTLPRYETKPDKCGFQARVSIGKRLTGKGKGRSKQDAEQQAAAQLFLKLETKHRHWRFSKSDSKRVIPV